MEDNRGVAERALQRRFEGNRLAEELGSMAYEQLWPMARKFLKQPQAVEQRLGCQGSDPRETVARRA